MSSPMEEFEAVRAETVTRAPAFVGLTTSEVTALTGRLGLAVRVMTTESQWRTADAHPRRITVRVQDGIVTRAGADY
jgi:hypothetical protein